jgi:hypothetical protein
MCGGDETTSPGYSGSRNPAQNEMRMKDVLFHNFFWYKGDKTASVPCPTETFWGTCTSAAIRQTALPRGILHLIKFGKRNSFIINHSWYDFAREELPVPMKYREPKQTTFVVRVCEGVFLPSFLFGKKTSEAASRILALR